METNPIEIADKQERLKPGELDKLFIEYYLETSSPKEAYTRACKAGGHDAKLQYAAQYGKAMFTRLADKISEAIDQAEIEDATLSRMIRRRLAMEAESESTQFQAANSLQRKRADKLEVSKPQDMDQIQDELERVRQRKKEITGNNG